MEKTLSNCIDLSKLPHDLWIFTAKAKVEHGKFKIVVLQSRTKHNLEPND